MKAAGAMAIVAVAAIAMLTAAGCACERTIGLNGGDGASEVGDSTDDPVDDPDAEEAFDSVDTLPEMLTDTRDAIADDPVPDA